MLDPSGTYREGFHLTQINRRLDFKGRAKLYTRMARVMDLAIPRSIMGCLVGTVHRMYPTKHRGPVTDRDTSISAEDSASGKGGFFQEADGCCTVQVPWLRCAVQSHSRLVEYDQATPDHHSIQGDPL